MRRRDHPFTSWIQREMEEKGKFKGGRGGQIVLIIPIDRTP